jgi:hypothetical protein
VSAALSSASHQVSFADRLTGLVEWVQKIPLGLRIFCVWLLFLAAIIASRWTTILSPVWFVDNDDTLRLIQVHDFLAGQSWFDMRQYRLDPPQGGDIHWSRISDIGLMIPIAVARLFVSDLWADRIAVILYPGLILLTILWLMVRTARDVFGATTILPVVFATLTSGSMLLQMLPGRIDHHGLQILFMVVMMLQFLQADCAPPTRFLRGMIAGAMMALSLGVGLETLPYIAAAQAGLLWLWARQTASPSFVRGVGFGMIGGCALVMLATISPALWTMAYSDAFGRAHAAALCAGGLLWIALSFIATANIRTRLLTGASASLLVAALLVSLFPELLLHPYARLDPYLRTWFLDNVQEAAPIHKYMKLTLAGAVMDGLYAVIAVVLSVALVVSEKEKAARDRLIIITLLLLAAFCIALTQIRAFSFVGAFAILPTGLMIARLRSIPNLRPLLLACVWIFCSMPGAGIFGRAAELMSGTANTQTDAEKNLEKKEETACLTRKDMAPLAALPKGLVLNPIDLGTRILAYTPHAVLAAPYHRVERGMKDSVQTYLGTPAQAEKIIRTRKVDYLVYCPSLAEMKIFIDAKPQGLLSQLSANKIPGWLEPVPMPKGNTLKVYRVKSQTRDVSRRSQTVPPALPE